MAFRLKLDEPIESGVRRIATEQIERVRRQISARVDPATEIHEARKSLKRIRALLRLAREGLGETVFAAENARFRTIAAALAPARDAHVVQQTVARLAAGGTDTAALEAIRVALLAHDATDAASAATVDIDDTATALDRAQRRVKRLAVDPDTFDTLVRGLVRNYRRGLDRFEAAYRDNGDETFHQWRKSVQTHWRHMALLSRAAPALFEAHIAAARELSQILGDDHDLAILKARIGALPEGAVPPAEADAVRRLIATRQDALRLAARPRGEIIFAETPKAHGRRIAAVWQGAGAVARLEAAAEATPAKAPAGRKRARPAAEVAGSG